MQFFLGLYSDPERRHSFGNCHWRTSGIAYSTTLFLLFVLFPSVCFAGPLMTGNSKFDRFLKTKGYTDDITNEVDRDDQYDSTVGRLTHSIDGSRVDAAETFTSQILRLLTLAGHDDTSDHWVGFIDRLGEPVEHYDSLLWWRMQREFLVKRVDRHTPFSDTFETLEKRVKDMVVTKNKAKRDWVQEHF